MAIENKKKCVFAGTFDPPTLGHQAMIEDCLKLFDEVVVAIMVPPPWSCTTSIRQALCRPLQ